MNLYVCEGLFTDSLYTFYSSVNNYTLVYAKEPPNDKFMLVESEAYNALNELELRWLADCISDMCEEPEERFITVDEWFEALKTAFLKSQEVENEQGNP